MNLLNRQPNVKFPKFLTVSKGSAHDTKGVASWQWFFFALLQAFNLYQLITHAMWRDELQTWSIVRESATIAELFRNMRYDGFPPLWYFFLWGLSFISRSSLTMQLFHFACSFAAQFLVMTRAPFSGIMKLAVVAGYYISFEYCIISRAYVLGVLLIFLFCAFYAWLAEHSAIKGGILGLLANTTVYGAMISLVFAGDELCAVFGRREDARDAGGSRGGIVRFMAVYVSLLMTSIAFMIPPDDGMYAAGWILNPELTEKFYLFCRNLIYMVPIPTPKTAFWNSLSVLDAGLWLTVPVSMLVLFAVWFALRSSARYLRIFAIGFIGIWVFSVVKYEGTVRHVGSLMVLFIACIWFAAESARVKRIAIYRSSQLAIWCILTANIVAWGIASYYHLRYDFSGSREMARIIQRFSNNSLPIVADVDYATSSVAGYLGHPLYYVTNRRAQTFIRWNRERMDSGSVAAIDLAHDLAGNNDGRVLLLLNYPMESLQTRLLARTRDVIVEDEVFYLYEYDEYN